MTIPTTDPRGVALDVVARRLPDPLLLVDDTGLILDANPAATKVFARPSDALRGRRLPELLATGQLAGAGIDVLAEEPPADDNPLVAAWRDSEHPAHHRLLLNPHSAFYSEQGLQEMRVKGSQACRNALTGRPISNIVNLQSPNRFNDQPQSVS